MKIVLLILISLSFNSFAGVMLDSANTVFKRGEYSKAISLYREGLYYFNENPTSCFYNIANSYYKLDSLSKSIVNYKICLSFSKNYVQAYINLANVYYKLADYPNSISTAKEALRIEPNNKLALMLLAESYRSLESYEKAIVTYEKIVEIDRNNERIYIVLSELYKNLGDYESAIYWLNNSPKTGRYIGVVYSKLAEIYEEKKDLKRALYYIKQAHLANKKDKWIYYKMVKYEIDLNLVNLAIEDIKNGLLIYKDFAELAILGGNLAFDKKNINLAEMFYSSAYKLGSPDAVIGLDNIRIYRKITLKK